jgi:hypothetical protein
MDRIKSSTYGNCDKSLFHSTAPPILDNHSRYIVSIMINCRKLGSRSAFRGHGALVPI